MQVVGFSTQGSSQAMDMSAFRRHEGQCPIFKSMTCYLSYFEHFLYMSSSASLDSRRVFSTPQAKVQLDMPRIKIVTAFVTVVCLMDQHHEFALLALNLLSLRKLMSSVSHLDVRQTDDNNACGTCGARRAISVQPLLWNQHVT